MPELNELATKTFEEDTTFSDKVHFVHVYVIEPHPMSPDISPYRGEVWEAEYSSKRMPTTYNERFAYAVDSVQLFEGEQIMVVDDLTPGSMNNPVWCTYGPCPNCAFLIGMDGKIDTVQTWVEASDLETRIRAIVN